MLYWSYSEAVTTPTVAKKDDNGDVHWLYPKQRVETLIQKLSDYTDEEVMLAIECRRSLREFEVDDDPSLAIIEMNKKLNELMSKKFNKIKGE